MRPSPLPHPPISSLLVEARCCRADREPLCAACPPSLPTGHRGTVCEVCLHTQPLPTQKPGTSLSPLGHLSSCQDSLSKDSRKCFSPTFLSNNTAWQVSVLRCSLSPRREVPGTASASKGLNAETVWIDTGGGDRVGSPQSFCKLTGNL